MFTVDVKQQCNNNNIVISNTDLKVLSQVKGYRADIEDIHVFE